MKILYDTSVLIPALLTGHANHPLAFQTLISSTQEDVQGYISAHSLAELYSVMTRLPQPLKLSPEEAHRIILDLLTVLVAVDLAAEDYKKCIGESIFTSACGWGDF